MPRTQLYTPSRGSETTGDREDDSWRLIQATWAPAYFWNMCCAEGDGYMHGLCSQPSRARKPLPGRALIPERAIYRNVFFVHPSSKIQADCFVWSSPRTQRSIPIPEGNRAPHNGAGTNLYERFERFRRQFSLSVKPPHTGPQSPHKGRTPEAHFLRVLVATGRRAGWRTRGQANTRKSNEQEC